VDRIAATCASSGSSAASAVGTPTPSERRAQRVADQTARTFVLIGPDSSSVVLSRSTEPAA
jgi:hypothetical protein